MSHNSWGMGQPASKQLSGEHVTLSLIQDGGILSRGQNSASKLPEVFACSINIWWIYQAI